jgi:hypothetical protein
MVDIENKTRSIQAKWEYRDHDGLERRGTFCLTHVLDIPSLFKMYPSILYKDPFHIETTSLTCTGTDRLKFNLMPFQPFMDQVWFHNDLGRLVILYTKSIIYTLENQMLTLIVTCCCFEEEAYPSGSMLISANSVVELKVFVYIM